MSTRFRSAATALLLLVSVAAPLLGACGRAKRYSTSEVVDAFREQTGERLVRVSRDSNETWDHLDIDGDVDHAWGFWNMYVVKDGETAGLLEDEDGRPLKVDGNGLYWEREDTFGDPYWIVTKRYGDNVVVSYIGDRTRAASLDESFDRMDTALSALD